MREFPGYTLTTLREESSELLQLVKIEALGRPDEGPVGHGDPMSNGMGGDW